MAEKLLDRTGSDGGVARAGPHASGRLRQETGPRIRRAGLSHDGSIV